MPYGIIRVKITRDGGSFNMEKEFIAELDQPTYQSMREIYGPNENAGADKYILTEYSGDKSDPILIGIAGKAIPVVPKNIVSKIEEYYFDKSLTEDGETVITKEDMRKLTSN